MQEMVLESVGLLEDVQTLAEIECQLPSSCLNEIFQRRFVDVHGLLYLKHYVEVRLFVRLHIRIRYVTVPSGYASRRLQRQNHLHREHVYDSREGELVVCTNDLLVSARNKSSL